jgi:hypothetical protein
MDNFYSTYTPDNGGGGGGGGGVTSLNTLSGAVTLAQGSGITITPSGNTLTIAATGGGGGMATDMSNMASPTLMNQSLLPASDETLDIGSSTKQFVDGYILQLFSNSISPPIGDYLNITTPSNGVGNSGGFAVSLGSASGTQGQFSFLKQGVPSVVGQVWTASDTTGTGYWAPASGGAPSNPLLDASSKASVDFYNRILFKSDGTTPSVNWGTWKLIDASGNVSMNWNNYTLQNPSFGDARTSIDYGTLFTLYDNQVGHGISIAWDARHLVANDGTTIAIDWNTPHMVNLLSNGMTPVSFQFQDNAGVFVGFKAPTAITTPIIWVLPPADGTANALLQTDGAGNLSFATGFTGTVSPVTSITVVNGLVTAVS